MNGFLKAIFGNIFLLIFMTCLPEVVSNDTLAIGVAVILAGGVAHSGKG